MIVQGGSVDARSLRSGGVLPLGRTSWRAAMAAVAVAALVALQAMPASLTSLARIPIGLGDAVGRALVGGTAGQGVPAALDAPAGIAATASGWTASDPRHGVSAAIASTGTVLVAGGSGRLFASLAARSIGGSAGSEARALHVTSSALTGDRLVQHMGPVTTAYQVAAAGLEQTFTVQRAAVPPGSLVVLDLGPSDGWAVQRGGGSLLMGGTRGGAALGYHGLRTTDATGIVVPSELRIAGESVQIVVHPSASTTFPITIDPTWSSESTPVATLAVSGNGYQTFGGGIAVSADGSTAVVGSTFSLSLGPDTAYVFHVANEGSWSNLSPVAVLSNGSSLEQGFGGSVAISADGSTVLIGGASGENAAYIYHAPSAASWSDMAAPTAALSDAATSGPSSFFGGEVALSGDGTTAFVEDNIALSSNNASGSVDVFHQPSESAWATTSAPTQTIDDPGAAGYAYFGHDISPSSDGTTVLVGAFGQNSAYVFRASSEAWSAPTLAATLSAPATPYSFGDSVALSGDGRTALVGNDGQVATSAVYVFTASSESAWASSSSPAATLTDAASNGYVGMSLSLSSDGTTALVGEPGGSPSTTGSAAIYQVANSGSWGSTSSPTARLTDGSAIADSAEGRFVALSADGGAAFVGDATASSRAGAAFVYGASPSSPPPTTTTTTPPTTTTTTTPPAPRHGYWLVGSDGGIFTFGSAGFFGSTGNLILQRPVVGIVPTADRQGYWLDASDGGVFSFGGTAFYGSIPGLGLHPAGSGLPNSLNAPIVGMVPSSDDRGYFMVASDGGVFAFGDARFAGSCPGIGGCSGAAVAVMPDHSGNGYWVVSSRGSVYAFGDAPYLGAPGRGPVTAAVSTADGRGYWVLLSDGEVLGYGDAGSLGSPAPGNFSAFDPATAIFTTSDGAGYWVSSALGSVWHFGDAPDDGDMSGTRLNGAVIAATGF